MNDTIHTFEVMFDGRQFFLNDLGKAIVMFTEHVHSFAHDEVSLFIDCEKVVEWKKKQGFTTEFEDLSKEGKWNDKMWHGMEY